MRALDGAVACRRSFERPTLAAISAGVGAHAGATSARALSPNDRGSSVGRRRPSPPARLSSHPPQRDGVASSRRFDIGGLRVEKTRCCPTVPDNLMRQAKNLHGGLLSWLIRSAQLRRPFSFSQLSRLISVRARTCPPQASPNSPPMAPDSPPISCAPDTDPATRGRVRRRNRSSP